MMQDGRWKNSGHIWERRPSPVLPLRIGRGWKASERKELEAGPPDTISRARPALLSCSRKCTNTSSALGGMASYTAWDRPALAPGTQNPKPGRAGSPPPALRTPSPGGPGPRPWHSERRAREGRVLKSLARLFVMSVVELDSGSWLSWAVFRGDFSTVSMMFPLPLRLSTGAH